MRGSVESPFEAQLQETVAMELNTGAGLSSCPLGTPNPHHKQLLYFG